MQSFATLTSTGERSTYFSMCVSLVSYGFQFKDYHLPAENSNNKCNSGKFKAERQCLLFLPFNN